MTPRPRLLMVARGRYRLPLDETLARRFDALAQLLDVRVLGTRVGPGTDSRFVLAPALGGKLEGALFYALLPWRIARELRRFQPDAVLVQGTHETALALLGRTLGRTKTPVICDVHGDWHAVTRLYGSRLRRLLDPLADVLARFAVRRADGIRTVSGYTTRIVRGEGREPTSTFPAYMDLRPFVDPPLVPLPQAPRVLFVGVLEAYKAIDVLAAAWRRVARDVPGAELHVVGDGTRVEVVEALARDVEGVRWTRRLDTAGIAAALDDACLLVLPSRSEGMGRVIVEALCRARPVLGSDVGGIPDLVIDGENGVLVRPGDVDALAAALTALLGDRPRLERLAANARLSADPWIATPQQFAERMRALVDAVSR
jgi:glycosyltransferase involved in cell wall biosynthesis